MRQSEGKIIIDQAYYVHELMDMKTSTMTFTEFRSIRQKLAYAAYSTMPHILVFATRLAQHTEIAGN